MKTPQRISAARKLSDETAEVSATRERASSVRRGNSMTQKRISVYATNIPASPKKHQSAVKKTEEDDLMEDNSAINLDDTPIAIQSAASDTGIDTVPGSGEVSDG